MIFWISFAIATFICIYSSFVVINFIFSKHAKPSLPGIYPEISILIAMRNEEFNIKKTLNSILSQDYPLQKIHLLIGDDNSTDKSQEIAYSILKKSNINFQIIAIKPSTILVGKANVLAQLAKKASSKYLIFTDADTIHPKSWLSTITAKAEEGYDMVCGITHPMGDRWFQEFNKLEWYNIWLNSLFLDKLNLATSAIGNNLLVRNEVFLTLGGFEALQHTVVEDFDLYQNFHHNNFKISRIHSINSDCYTESPSTIKDLLIQRKRWLSGAFRTPLIIQLLFLTKLLFYPSLLYISFFNLYFSIVFLFIKTIIQILSIYGFIKRSNLRRFNNPFKLLFSDLYLDTFAIISFVYFFSSKNILWKGRKL